MRISVGRAARAVFVCAAPVTLLAAVPGCGQDEQPYKPVPAYSGRKANLPAVPTLPNKPIKVGDSYTVWGVQHHLKSRVHNADVNGKELTLTGYIVKTNLPDAPECAVHKTGKGDKEDCKAQIPAFWITDEKGGDQKNAIKVMGWASNFAQIYDGIQKYSAKTVGDTPPETVKDEFWGQDIPNPIPNVGAKVSVAGTYGVSFTKATSGVETDPLHGVMTAAKITYLEPPSEPATLPGMKVTPGGAAPAPKKK
jgi:hypothetical protein